MYERFTKRAEAIVKLAGQIAREYELDYVGTEHVLLAIRREGTGRGSALLEQRGISEEKLKSEVDRLIKKSMEDTWVFGRLPGTPHFRNVIAHAIELASSMKSREVCSEHLLLALMKEPGSVAFATLKNLECSFDELQAEVVQQTGT